MRRIPMVFLLLTLLVGSFFAAGPALRAGAQTGTPETSLTPTEPAGQPGQPATGPGGADLAYDGITAQHFGPQPDGTGDATGYWLFEPVGPHPGVTATKLPLVIFMHGFNVLDPEIYHAWIDHLVRRGAILIYPDYQAANLGGDDPTGDAVESSGAGFIQTSVRAALTELSSESQVQPDLGRVAVIGHSQGAVLAADYAGRAATAGMPVPEALLIAMPGCSPGCDLSFVSKIPTTTRVLILVGNQDTLAGEDWAKSIWSHLGQIPAAQKSYIRFIGDDHGHPALVADHFVSWTTSAIFFGEPVGTLDPYDWYGSWKFLDGLMSCSFAGQDCQYALGDTSEQRFMGTWSDGTPVTEAQIVADPGTPTP